VLSDGNPVFRRKDNGPVKLLAQQDTKPTRSAIWLSVTVWLAPEVYEGFQLSFCDNEDKFG
jgi:hypothetical protein